MRLYLAGQTNFGNRGCEALVRSTAQLVSKRFGVTEFLVPSVSPELDGQQWHGDATSLVRFVTPLQVPASVKWWNRLASRWAGTTGLWEPRFDLPTPIKADVLSCDAVLMIGGDNISLDYGLGSLFMWSGLADAAARLGKPTMLFAASVGPFRANLVAERFMASHLRRYSAVTVRESASMAYLAEIGVPGACLVADPAFVLQPQSCELPSLFQQGGAGVLGLNLSPLIQAVRDRAGPACSIAEEAVAFVNHVLTTTELSVLLVPHVDPLDGGDWNSDSVYMNGITQCFANNARVQQLGRGFNAAQLKHVIGACRYFIGARTHSTVAAWSMGVPTVSIAYSLKALGLNQDLFESADYVLDTSKVSRATLADALGMLVQREQFLRALLARKIPLWRNNAELSTETLAKVLR